MPSERHDSRTWWKDRRVWIDTIIPGFILFALWLDGWFFPLILLPILYVLLVEKRSLGWLGFSTKNLWLSIVFGAAIAFALILVYYPIFMYYLPLILAGETPDLYVLFLDVVWYPAYEEVAYRSFALAHFAEPNGSCMSKRNVIVNLLQSILFVSIHGQHFTTPLVLIPVFLLALFNGCLFLRTKNAWGCIVSHSASNALALLLRYLYGG